MKKIHIVAIVVIAIALAVIVSTISNSSTYAPFRTAIENEGNTFHVVGKVNLQKDFIYNPQENANIFGFYLVDSEGLEKLVLYNGTKPQDFERSEQIVVVGKMKEDKFIANQLLMKCPSKYNGNQQDQMKAVQ
ncbi:MAG: cytochrome c maturation protein CcmE [Bacteroidetes bacterium]|jgi:cytochrome c-type biogenesis protein CcmE|nr:cytochrome c maturation protein CcmE [Bacteroidota bacterium]MBK9319525.1 cytochrome c maturation protein CcmE [Bacteroidota bacterium]